MSRLPREPVVLTGAFANEVGTGSGPTSEFFALVCQESLNVAGMWRHTARLPLPQPQTTTVAAALAKNHNAIVARRCTSCVCHHTTTGSVSAVPCALTLSLTLSRPWRLPRCSQTTFEDVGVDTYGAYNRFAGPVMEEAYGCACGGYCELFRCVQPRRAVHGVHMGTRAS